MSRSPTVSRALKKRIDGIAAQLTGRETPATLRSYAEQARAQGDWARDAYFRRRIAELEPERFGAWVQLGHALKETGFHAKAEGAYRRAMELKPDDKEVVVQLAHLAKVRGDFEEARRCFEDALGGGHPDRTEIEAELRRLRQSDNSTIFWDVARDAAPVPLRVFLSSPSKLMDESAKAGLEAGLGHAEYSYAFAMRGFAEALRELEIDFTVLERPENIADIRERSEGEVNIHLGFYPPERIRLLKGAYNIICFAWEFDRLRNPEEVISYHAFADQAEMLDVADEIWVPSSHGAEVVRARVSKPVRHVQSPVLSNLTRHPRDQAPSGREVLRAARDLLSTSWEPLAVLGRLQPTLDYAARRRRAPLQSILAGAGIAEPRLYLSLFNVHDYRKQIEPMLDGFLRFIEDDPNAILLLKITTPQRGRLNAHLLGEQLANSERLLRPLVSNRVWLTDDVLSRADLNRLYDAAAFYLCTSHGEGQNLVLLEAMGRGVVPVSVDNTAMADYISPDNAIVIPSRRESFDVRLARRYAMYGAPTYFATGDDVRDALKRSAALSPAEYGRLSAAAQAQVRDQFGLAPFARSFETMIASLRKEEQA